MMRRIWTALLFALYFLPFAPGAAAGVAEDRGRLSLAWDAHDSGLFEEALGYLKEILPASPLAADAVWLTAECLYDSGRYAEAADALQSEAAQGLPAREAFLLEVYWDWAWEATGRGAYREASEVLEKARTSLPEEPALAALAEATRFRAALARVADGGAGRLPGGEEVSVRAPGTAPPGPDWLLAYPWKPETSWVPQTTLDDWMPSLAARLHDGSRALWVRVSRRELRHRLEAAARAAELEVRSGPVRLVLRSEEEAVALDLNEWAFRAATEGLGLEGAVCFALEHARQQLQGRAALVRWIRANRGAIEVERTGPILRLRSPLTGRGFELDPGVWAKVFDPELPEWEEFWTDLKAELDRPPRPYRCFCGREAVLREVLVTDPGRALVFEKGPGYSVSVIAMCPLHQQYVTTDLVHTWGVGPQAVWSRASTDALRSPWELIFERGEVDGNGYLLLEGEGIAALARVPQLLLGALEAVNGAGAGGMTVKVVAPSNSTLVVASASAPDSTTETAAARALLAAGRRGDPVDRLNYRATVHLPGAGAGSFRLSPAE